MGMKGEAFRGGLSHRKLLKPTEQKTNNIPSSIQTLVKRIDQEISFGKWNETWSGALERCVVEAEGINKVERSRCYSCTGMTLICKQSSQDKDENSTERGLGSRGLGPS